MSNASVFDYFETEIAINWINEKGWLCSKSKDVPLTVENISNHYQEIGLRAGKLPLCFIVWPNFSQPAPPEVRRYLSDNFPKFTTAAAVVTTNAMMRIGINLFSSITRTKVPMRVFATEVAAIEWLMKIESSLRA